MVKLLFFNHIISSILIAILTLDSKVILKLLHTISGEGNEVNLAPLP
jgi:hypothetical protein